jgi:co-chaperonin GroES (HSP10)
MPSTKPATKGEALPSSATTKKLPFIPSVVNPYSEFTQPQFDAFVSDITTKIRDALQGGRKRDKGKGKDMSLFDENTSTTSVEQGDAMGFEQFSFSNKVRNGLNGSFPLDAADVLTDEEESGDTEHVEQEEVEGSAKEPILWPPSDEEQELQEPPQVVIQGAGGVDDPIVIDLLDSDEEESPHINGKRLIAHHIAHHEESEVEEESDNEGGEDEDVSEQQQNNVIAIGSREESEHDQEQPVRIQESDQLDAGEVVSSYMRRSIFLFVTV